MTNTNKINLLENIVLQHQRDILKAMDRADKPVEITYSLLPASKRIVKPIKKAKKKKDAVASNEA